jgi:predicted phosphodiesterase
MRVALISDIHANLPALQAVLADIDARADVTGTLHVGDLVGYAPWPNEVVALLRERGISGVAGNYDSTVATHYEHCGCRYEDPRQEALAHESYAWTLAHTSDASKRWLGALPFSVTVRADGGHKSGAKLVLVHGTPVLNTAYWHADRDDDFCRSMAEKAQLKSGDLIAFGHTHKPWTRVVDGMTFVNTGSVGRPKDGDPRAGYAIVEHGDNGWNVEFIRVAYDVDASAQGILAAGLPREFAEYLRSGGARLDPL